MFDQYDSKKLILVHSDYTEVFANYLQLLISSSGEEDRKNAGDENRTVETVIWSEKEYTAQKPTLSSVDHIVFIGRGKTIEKETYGMKTRFEKYGMRYGWLGKRAFLNVSGEDLNKKQLAEFIEYIKEYDPERNEIDVKYNNVPAAAKRKGISNILKKGSPAILSFPALPVGGLPFFGVHMLINIFITKGVMSDKMKDSIRSSQYHVATIIFYKEGLADFLKN